MNVDPTLKPFADSARSGYYINICNTESQKQNKSHISV